jgi:hypothetical protein
MSARATPLTALAFETIRQETSGQITLVGGLSSTIGAAAFPVMIGFDVVIVARLEGRGQTELEFAYALPREAKLSGFKIGMEIGEPDDAATLVAPTFIAEVLEPGEIAMKWRQSGTTEWELLKSWQVKQMAMPAGLTPETDAPLAQEAP